MEVPGRPADAPGQLSGRAVARRALVRPALACATVVAVAALLTAAQPVDSPWWTYADADASYAASALNLLAGEEVTFVDHPGLPLTEATALAFGVQALLEEGGLSHESRLRFVDEHLLDLDDTRGVFRGIPIAIYLAGALLAFLLPARLFGHWTWGLACGLLWIAAPGLAPMAIQLRPDVLLTLLSLVVAYHLGRAVERCSLAHYVAAAALVGFATMVKVHAVGLLVPLAVAAIWRSPRRTEVAPAMRRGAAWTRAHAPAIGAAAGAYLVLAALLNAERFPFDPTNAQLMAGAGLVASATVLAVLTRLAAARFPALLGLAFVGGVLAPILLDVQDGLRAIVYVARNASGRGVQQGIESFSVPVSTLDELVGPRAMLVFALAAVATALGLVRRDPRPVVWGAGALAMGVLAYARPPNVHYLAPSFVLSALALAWLLQRTPREPASLLVWPAVLLIVWPAWDGRGAAALEQERIAEAAEPAKRFLDRRVRAGEVTLVPSYWPGADSRFFELVEIDVEHTPLYPYRYLPTTRAARSLAAERGLRARWYASPDAGRLPRGHPVELGALGSYTLGSAHAGGTVAQLVSGPGADRPWTP